MQITVLVGPTTDLPFAAGPERYQRFADELARHAGTPVPVVKDAPGGALPGGYLLWVTSGDPERLLARCGSEGAVPLAARTVLLDASWQQALGQLERYRFAGAVDSLRLSEWAARPSGGKGPFGLRYLAKPLGLRCAPLPWFQSDHYCRLDSDRHHGLAHILADYLIAYDRDQKSSTISGTMRKGDGHPDGLSPEELGSSVSMP